MATIRRISNYHGPACPACGKDVGFDALSDGWQQCPHCTVEFEARVFHPPQRSARVLQLAQVGPEGASACANHARNAAVAACDRCGLFICSLCEIDIEGGKYCPSCFERLSKDGGMATATRIRDYGSRAVLCAVVGLFPVFGLPLGLMAFFYAFKATRKNSETSMSMLGIILALLLAFVDIALGTLFLVGLLYPKVF